MLEADDLVGWRSGRILPESATGGMMDAVVGAAEARTAAEQPGSDSAAPGHVADVSSTGWRSWSGHQTSHSAAAKSIVFVQSESAARKHLVEQH